MNRLINEFGRRFKAIVDRQGKLGYIILMIIASASYNIASILSYFMFYDSSSVYASLFRVFYGMGLGSILMYNLGYQLFGGGK